MRTLSRTAIGNLTYFDFLQTVFFTSNFRDLKRSHNCGPVHRKSVESECGAGGAPLKDFKRDPAGSKIRGQPRYERLYIQLQTVRGVQTGSSPD